MVPIECKGEQRPIPAVGSPECGCYGELSVLIPAPCQPALHLNASPKSIRSAGPGAPTSARRSCLHPLLLCTWVGGHSSGSIAPNLLVFLCPKLPLDAQCMELTPHHSSSMTPSVSILQSSQSPSHPRAAGGGCEHGCEFRASMPNLGVDVGKGTPMVRTAKPAVSWMRIPERELTSAGRKTQQPAGCPCPIVGGSPSQY